MARAASSVVAPFVVPPSWVEPAQSANPYRIGINYVKGAPSAEVQNLITISKLFLETILVRSHGRRSKSISMVFDMMVDIELKALSAGILASARPTMADVAVTPAVPLRQSIVLNSNALNTNSLLSMVQFNNTAAPKLIPVMIHEMLHGLGIASINTPYKNVGWNQFLDSTRTWYVGPNGDASKSSAVQAYREVVGGSVQRIPVENSFGSGTSYSHWEEGLKEGFVKEPRYHAYGGGNVFHPALPEEIMTGVAGSRFYFTMLTAGALEDHRYAVNRNSVNIVPYPASLIQKP